MHACMHYLSHHLDRYGEILQRGSRRLQRNDCAHLVCDGSACGHVAKLHSQEIDLTAAPDLIRQVGTPNRVIVLAAMICQQLVWCGLWFSYK